MLAWLRRILSILLAAGLLVACNTTLEVSDNPDERESKLSGTIIFWHSFPQSRFTESLISRYEELFAEYIEKFTKLYPEVHIIMEFIAEEDLVEELEREVEKGLGPDVIYGRSIKILPLIKAQALLPVDEDAIELWQFRSEALEQVIYQGQVYGVPIDLWTQVLCYNKKKVKVQEPPKTLSELITQARTGYSVGLLSSFEDTVWGTQIFGAQLLDAQGRIILDQGGGWVRWMEWLINAKNEPNFILNQDHRVIQNAFIEEKLTYGVCWSAIIPFLIESLGSDKLGVALLPGGENEQFTEGENEQLLGEVNQQAAPPLVVNALVFSSASSANQNQIALKFAQLLSNTQQQKTLAAGLRSFIPANKSAIIDPRLFPIQGILQKQSQQAFVFSLNQTNKTNAITNYGRDFYTRVMAGEMSPEEAANQLTQTINSQFEEP